MSYFYEKNLEYDGVLQGDVFEVGNLCEDIFLDNEKWAVVITADCDIENKKMGNMFTVLPIILADDYLEEIWLVETFDREKKALIDKAVELINASKIHSKNDCHEVTYDSMIQWLKEEDLKSIFQLLKLDVTSNKFIELEVKLSIMSKGAYLKNYIELRTYQKRSEKKIKKEIMEAIKQCRDEFYFVPDIPCSKSIGLMIKLRSIRGMHESRVFKSERDSRLSLDDKEKAIIRVGRFSDYLRYSITQSFALLFSRIGMPSQFENDNNAAIDLISSSIWSKYNEL